MKPENLWDQHRHSGWSLLPLATLPLSWTGERAASGHSGANGMGMLGTSISSNAPTFSRVKIGSSHQEAQPILSPCGGCFANNARQDGRPQARLPPLLGWEGGSACTPCPRPLREWAPRTSCARKKCLARGQALAATSGQSRTSQAQLRSQPTPVQHLPPLPWARLGTGRESRRGLNTCSGPSLCLGRCPRGRDSASQDYMPGSGLVLHPGWLLLLSLTTGI